MISEKIAGLNLGSRNRAIPDFFNMDCDQHPGVDIVGDVSDLSRFADNSIPEIYGSHVIEHFPHTKTLDVLKEWHRVIEPGGKLYIAVPDLARAVEIYQALGLRPWVTNFLMGDQCYKTAYHYNLFDEAKLTAMLKDAGFADSFRVEQFPIGDPQDCSNQVSNYDNQSVSLNMIAVKKL